MTKYKVYFDKRYLKDLEKISSPFRERIHEKVESLAINPRPDGYTKLSGLKKMTLYRVRCGDYRIVYTIQDQELIVVIIELGRRREIYRNL